MDAGMAAGAGAAGSAADDIEASGSRIEGALGSAGIAAGGLGAAAGDAADDVGDAAEDAGGAAEGMGAGIGKASLIATAALAGVAAVSLDMATKFQSSVTQLAASADIPVSKAQAIGNAFLDTAGTSIFSAQTMIAAYAPVAAQLAVVQGHALTVAQASTVMASAANLAEASNTSLSSATSALAKVMQVYGQTASSAANDSNILYKVGIETGTGATAVAQSFSRLHTQLGALTPPLAQTGGLLVDLTSHGETGRQAMSALNQAVSALIKPSNDYNVAIQNQKSLLDNMPPSLQALARSYQSGQITSEDFTTATENLTPAQAQLASAFASAVTKQEAAKETMDEMGFSAINAQGKFIGLGNVIKDLDAKLKGETQAVQLATLSQDIGTTASRKLLDTVLAGPAAYDKYVASVDKANSAANAAAQQNQSLDKQFEILKATGEDLAVKLGSALLPLFTKLLRGFTDLVGWLIKTKPALIALGVVAAAFAAVMVGSFVSSLIETIGAVVELIGAYGSLILVYAQLAIAQLAALWPYIAIAAAVAALGVAIYELVDHWRTVWNFLKSIAEPVWQFLENDIFHPMEHALQPVITAFQAAFSVMQALFSSTFDAIADIVKAAWDVISDTFKTAWDIISTIVSTAVGVVEGIIKVFIDLITGNWTAAWNAIKQIVQTAWSGIEAVFDDVTSFISGTFTTVINAFKSAWDAVWGGIKTAVSDAWSFISGVFDDIVSGISTGITDAINSLSSIWDTIWSGIKTAVSDAWNDVLKPIFDAIKDALSGIASVAGTVAHVIGDITGAAGSVIGGVAHFFGFAEGGYITTPTLAVVGESGPEVVLPLSNPSRMAEILSSAGVGLPSIASGGLGAAPGPSNDTQSQILQAMLQQNEISQAIADGLGKLGQALPAAFVAGMNSNNQQFANLLQRAIP
jgi:phage-related protein